MFYEIKNFNFHEKYNEIIMNSCKCNNIKVIKWLKNNNSKLLNKYELIYWTCKYGQIEILNWLSDDNFDFESVKHTLLKTSLQYENYNIIKWYKSKYMI